MNELRQIQVKESYEKLLYYHNIIQNLTISQNELEQIFEEKEESDIEIENNEWGVINVVNKVICWEGTVAWKVISAQSKIDTLDFHAA